MTHHPPEQVTAWIAAWMATVREPRDPKILSLAGDGSTRLFFRLHWPDKSLILLFDPAWEMSRDYPAHQKFFSDLKLHSRAQFRTRPAVTQFKCIFARCADFKNKSRIIKFPKTKLTRPMTDRGKETVFNIVGSLIPGKHVLDLYSGSGSIGLEAISRGALDVAFVEQSPSATRVIKQNIDLLGVRHKTLIIQEDVLHAIDKLKKKKMAFSLVFMDPPYDKGWVKKTLLRLDQSGIVLPFGQVVVGHSSYEEIPEGLETLRLTRTKKVGQSRFSFLFRLESSHGETKSYLSGEF